MLYSGGHGRSESRLVAICGRVPALGSLARRGPSMSRAPVRGLAADNGPRRGRRGPPGPGQGRRTDAPRPDRARLRVAGAAAPPAAPARALVTWSATRCYRRMAANAAPRETLAGRRLASGERGRWPELRRIGEETW